MSAPGSIWMPLYVADFQSDTSHLTGDEIGAFILLLCATWRSGKPLPDDDKRLAQLCRTTPKKWSAIKSAVMGMFELSESGWIRSDVERERDKANQRSQSSSARGAKGGRPKLLKTLETQKAVAFSQLSQNESSSFENQKLDESPSPSPSPKKERISLPSEAQPIQPDLGLGQSGQVVAIIRSKRPSRLPDGWTPTAEGLRVAKQYGVPMPLTLERFRDYWHGKGKPMADWDATWRNWCRSDYNRPVGAPPPKTGGLKKWYGRTIDPAYFAPNKPEYVASLPKPKPSSPEIFAWMDARDDISTPYPKEDIAS